MVVLNKIKASTLMEVLVATILLLIIFMVASMVLNSIVVNTVKFDDQNKKSYLKELEYLLLNEKISIPYYEEKNNWEIEIYEENILNESNYYILELLDTKKNQKIKQKIYVVSN